MATLHTEADQLVQTDTACYRHPEQETGLRCIHCERPICLRCVEPAAVDQVCRACVRARRLVKHRLSLGALAVAAPATGVLSLVLCALTLTLIAPLASPRQAPQDLPDRGWYRDGIGHPAGCAGGARAGCSSRRRAGADLRREPGSQDHDRPALIVPAGRRRYHNYVDTGAAQWPLPRRTGDERSRHARGDSVQ
jgi:hypothetical protein